MFRAAVACFVAGLALATTPLARAAPPPIEAYAKDPLIGRISLSPSGKRAAILVSGEKGGVVAVQDVGGKILVTVGVGLVKLRDLSWAGDEYLLITTSQTVNLGWWYGYKHELATVRALNVATHKVVEVFEKGPSEIRATFGDYGVAKIDGRWYGFFGSLGDDQIDLYRVDLETGQLKLAARGNGKDHDWVVGPDGAVIAHSEYDAKTGEWRLLRGPGSGGSSILTRTTKLAEVELIGQGRRPGTVLVIDDSGEADLVLEVSLADGKTEELFASNGVDSYMFDRTTGLLLGAETPEAPGVVLFDPKLQAKVRGAFKAFPGFHTTLQSHDPSFDNMIVRTDGGSDSGTYWYVDIGQGKALPLSAERPAVPAADVGPTRMYAYKARDGLELEGVLTLPPGKPGARLPVIVMPHGGPIGVRDDVGFDWWAQAFAVRGYAVFQPNFRGSGGRSPAFRDAGYGEWGRRMLTDMSEGVSALAVEGIIDPKRACIVGASYGGYAALAGVTVQQGLYRCAVAFAGVSDLFSFTDWVFARSGSNPATMRYWKAALKGQAGDGPSKDAISPAKLAARADAPVLLIHGKDDTVVPVEQSRRMQGALRGAGKPVELIELQGQDHWLTDEATRVQMLTAAVAFVEKHNPAN